MLKQKKIDEQLSLSRRAIPGVIGTDPAPAATVEDLVFSGRHCGWKKNVLNDFETRESMIINAHTEKTMKISEL